MNFFRARYDNHQRIYSHQKTTAASFMICDILLLAEPHLRISTENEGDDPTQDAVDNANLRLPISRANINAESYLKLKDGIINVIEASSEPELRPARLLVNRFRQHKIYKKCCETTIDLENDDKAWMKDVWEMNISSIVNGIMENDDSATLAKDDIIVEKMKIHYGMKALNRKCSVLCVRLHAGTTTILRLTLCMLFSAVSCVRFLGDDGLAGIENDPENLPEGKAMPQSAYKCSIPESFQQTSIRLYCRSQSKDTQECLKQCYNQFIVNIQSEHGRPKEEDMRMSFEIEEPIVAESPARHNQLNILTQSPNACTNSPSFADDDDYTPRGEKRFCSSNNKDRTPLFAKIQKKARRTIDFDGN